MVPTELVDVSVELVSIACSHELANTCVGNEATFVEECLSGGAAASLLSGDCTADASAVSRESEYIDAAAIDAGTGMVFSGEANMSAIIGEDQYDDFEEEVVIEEWVFFDEGEEDNSCDADGLVCERIGSYVSGLSGLEVSEIALDASNATSMVLEETSTEALTEDVSVFETTREIWCQDIMHRAIWVFDPGKDELSFGSNYGPGTVGLADISMREGQSVDLRSLTESNFVLQRWLPE